MLITKFLSIALLVGCVQAYGSKETYGMRPLDVKNKPKSEFYEIANMPKVRSQDTIGLCYSFVASTLIDHQTCIDKKITPCAGMSDDLRVTPLDVSRFTSDPVGDPNNRQSYSGINDGGSLSTTLQNALRGGNIVNEACAPFGQVVANIDGEEDRKRVEEGLWRQLKKLHEDRLNRKCRNCDNETVTALDNIRKDFEFKASNADILKAMGENTFAKFLDKMLVPNECKLLGLAEIKTDYKVSVYPTKDMPRKDSSYEPFINEIKRILSVDKVPIGLSFCAKAGVFNDSTSSDCSPKPGETSSDAGGAHSVVIKGYRKVCEKKKGCYEALQIQNSWGQQWQKDNEDGWVDARELLRRTSYAKASFTWLIPVKN